MVACFGDATVCVFAADYSEVRVPPSTILALKGEHHSPPHALLSLCAWAVYEFTKDPSGEGHKPAQLYLWAVVGVHL